MNCGKNVNDMPIIYFLGEKKFAIVGEIIINDYQILRNREAVIPQCGRQFRERGRKSLQCLSEKIKVIYGSAEMLNFTIAKDSEDGVLL